MITRIAESGYIQTIARSCVILVFLFLASLQCSSQPDEAKVLEDRSYHYGGYVTFGTATIKSKSAFKDYFSTRLEESDTIDDNSFRRRVGTIYGIGGNMSFAFSKIIHVYGGVHYQAQRNAIEVMEKLAYSAGRYDKYFSTVWIKVSSIAAHASSKIRFFTGDETPFKEKFYPYIRTGILYEARVSKKMNFEESTLIYDGTKNPYKTDVVTIKYQKAEGYSNTGLNFEAVFGADFIFLDYDKTRFFIEFIYTTGLTTSPLWVKEFVSESGTPAHNSAIFEQSVQESAAKKYGVNFGDWKNSGLRISMGILF